MYTESFKQSSLTYLVHTILDCIYSVHTHTHSGVHIILQCCIQSQEMSLYPAEHVLSVSQTQISFFMPSLISLRAAVMCYCVISNKTEIEPAGSLMLKVEHKLNKTNVFLSEIHSFRYLWVKREQSNNAFSWANIGNVEIIRLA